MLISWQKKKICLKSLIPCGVQLESWKRNGKHGQLKTLGLCSMSAAPPTTNHCRQEQPASSKQVASEGKAPVEAAVVATFKKADAANSGDSDKELAAFSAEEKELLEVADMMEEKGPGVSLMAKTIHQKMDLSTAVRRFDGKLPNDVASLVHMATTEKNAGALDEDSMQRPRLKT